MIRSFQDKHTAAVFAGKRPASFPVDLFRRARNKLLMVNAATALDDLKVHRATDFTRSTEIGQVSMRFGSMTNIGSASDGLRPVRKTSRSSTIIEDAAS